MPGGGFLQSARTCRILACQVSRATVWNPEPGKANKCNLGGTDCPECHADVEILTWNSPTTGQLQDH